MGIDCLVLGAGQEVGKSCAVVTMGGKRIMFDCGMHMAYQDLRRYPDFSSVLRPGEPPIACVIITHFHLDHVGALPYFTEVCGYSGPIYMTYPTKALAPLMLEDFRKVIVDRRGEKELFTAQQILDCMGKVIAVDLRQTVQVDPDIQIRAYYAGHVLGAAMFYAKVGNSSVLYTGDYNMTPDRHLGAAQVDRLQPDLLITESTYATTVRESKLAREREFVQAVHSCVGAGGKVLIPVFAMGRAQELCILLDDYWERMNLKVPIYFSSGLTIQANMYYKMLIGWTNQKVKDACVTHNPFDFKHVRDFERSQIYNPGPCVLFATPGMLTGGFSLEVFKQWAPSEQNLVALPGYSVAGTIGHKLMSGKPTRIDLDKDTHIDVRCKIHQVSFSPHTDAKGIMDLVKLVSPDHVILVHGEKPKMAILKGKIQSDLGLPCYYPANNESVHVSTTQAVKVDVTKTFMKSNLRSISDCLYKIIKNDADTLRWTVEVGREHKHQASIAEGILVMEKAKRAKIMHEAELLPALNAEEHEIQFAYCCPVRISSIEHKHLCLADGGSMELFNDSRGEFASTPSSSIVSSVSSNRVQSTSSECCRLLQWLFIELKKAIDEDIKVTADSIQLNSLNIQTCLKNSCSYRKEKIDDCQQMVFFCCRWSLVDEKYATAVLSIMRALN
ncbi:cleavage and polyadenylation specificity factor subunit 3-II [Nymphaea colorata]|nr:cleavage and polyadenylation specificity factor subunit 3-II [Nymphaea colorata]